LEETCGALVSTTWGGFDDKIGNGTPPGGG